MDQHISTIAHTRILERILETSSRLFRCFCWCDSRLKQVDRRHRFGIFVSSPLACILLAGHSNRSGFQTALCCWNQMKFRMFGLANYTFQTEHVSLCRRMFTFSGSNDIPRDTYVIGPHVVSTLSRRDIQPTKQFIRTYIYKACLPFFLLNRQPSLLLIFFQYIFKSTSYQPV